MSARRRFWILFLGVAGFLGVCVWLVSISAPRPALAPMVVPQRPGPRPEVPAVEPPIPRLPGPAAEPTATLPALPTLSDTRPAETINNIIDRFVDDVPDTR